MSDPRTSPIIDANQNVKRNLPSWMSSRDSESISHGKKSADAAHDEENSGGKTNKKAKDSGNTSSKKIESSKKSSPSNSDATNFSKLLEGVVFVLSGFVNPERSTLRSQALEMGAEYQPDWNTSCTLLVCAFPNTPKFRQVEADCGTIVFKEWILECHSQRKLVDIESYLMYAGKPWRRQNISHETSEDLKSSVSGKSLTRLERQSNVKPTTVVSTKSGGSNHAKDSLSPSKVKKWALDDLNKTISWLENQEEKPETSEIKKIAAEGILTCLQDAVDSLQQKQDLRHMLEQWKFIPRVVEELAKLESTANDSKEALCKEAMDCKQIYETELSSLGDDSSARKRRRTGKTNKDDAADYDSDETIEMTEEEIDLAYKSVASKLSKQ